MKKSLFALAGLVLALGFTGCARDCEEPCPVEKCTVKTVTRTVPVNPCAPICP